MCGTSVVSWRSKIGLCDSCNFRNIWLLAELQLGPSHRITTPPKEIYTTYLRNYSYHLKQQLPYVQTRISPSTIFAVYSLRLKGAHLTCFELLIQRPCWNPKPLGQRDRCQCLKRMHITANKILRKNNVQRLDLNLQNRTVCELKSDALTTRPSACVRPL